MPTFPQEISMDRYSKVVIEALSDDERDLRLKELENILVARLRQASEFNTAVYKIVDDLRKLGHDLWSFDASDEMQIWAPNYTRPDMYGLIMTVDAPDRVLLEWKLPGK